MHFVKRIVPGVLFLLLFSACQAKNDGAVSGTVTPPAQGVRITVSQNSKAVATTEANAQDGVFRTTLPPGAYDVNVSAPSSPFPVSFPGVVVKPGETTVLPPVSLASATGGSALSGKIAAAGAGTRVTLLYEGQERASVNANAEGRYEFTALPAGHYTLQVSSPGYANESAAINLGDNQKTTQDLRLLYVTSIDGVDWTSGKIKARGIGMPPREAANPTVRREMAKRAAVADAERNLLNIIQQIQVDPSRKLITVLGEGTYVRKIQGYLQGHRIVSERDLDGGRIEVELELPLTGPGGLSSSVQF